MPSPKVLKNLGRSINLIPGISGVAAGGNASVNMSCNRRYHRNIFRTTSINYTAPAIALVGAGTYNATLTPTVTSGVITAVAITAGGSGMTNGTYTSAGGGVRITDATGIGAQLSITVASGAVSAVTIVSGGIPGPCNPATMLTSLRQLVGGVTVRDITPNNILAIAAACGYLPQYGELPLLYTEPRRNFLRDNELTSWDMTGQSTFEIDFGISATASTPGIAGISEFDGRQNLMTIKTQDQATQFGQAIGTQIPVLQPVNQHQQGFQLAAGQNDINTVSHNYPITRLWLIGATPGNITRLEIYADGNKVLEGYTQDLNEAYAEYGFQVGNCFSAPSAAGGYGNGSPGLTGVTSGNGAATQIPTTEPNGTLAGSPWLGLNGVFPFDAAFIADPDGRPWKALRAKDLIVRIYSAVAQQVTIISEALPGSVRGLTFMEGEDISPAVALSSPIETDPLEADSTTFIFGTGNQANSSAEQTPAQTSTATATATSAPNSPASATSNVVPAGTVAASGGTSGPNWLLIGGIAILGLLLFHK